MLRKMQVVLGGGLISFLRRSMELECTPKPPRYSLSSLGSVLAPDSPDIILPRPLP